VVPPLRVSIGFDPLADTKNGFLGAVACGDRHMNVKNSTGECIKTWHFEVKKIRKIFWGIALFPGTDIPSGEPPLHILPLSMPRSTIPCALGAIFKLVNSPL